MKLSKFLNLVHLMNRKRLQVSEVMPDLYKNRGDFTASRLKSLNFFKEYGAYLEAPELEEDFEVDGTSVNIAIRYFDIAKYLREQKLGTGDILVKLFTIGDNFCNLTNDICVKQIEIIRIHTHFLAVHSKEMKELLDFMDTDNIIKEFNVKLSGGAL